MSAQKRKLLIIDDDRVFGMMLKKHFEGTYQVTCFSDPEEAAAHIKENHCDVVLTDLSMPKIDGIEILKIVKTEQYDTDVVIMTAFARVDTAVEAMKKGAYDFIVKPFTLDEISMLLGNVFDKRRLSEENTNFKRLIDTGFRPEGLIGESEAMKEVYRFIERVAPTVATVLITGESGTGKGMVAKALHLESKKKDKQFVSLSCTAIPDTLLESELFGYVKGAFSGAHRDKMGLFEYADGGTLFLDEIGDASLAVQAKLLKVLQERRLRPIGGTTEVSIDVRVVCATNQDLTSMIKENRFREDLYYRINVVSISLPPLRDRKGDIPLLISSFLRERKKINSKAASMLVHYSWPGNVRELKNTVERLIALSDSDIIMAEDLPGEISKPPCLLDDEGLSYQEIKQRILDEFNRTIITKSLLKHDGNATKAAEALKLDRANFLRLLRKHKISSKDFK